MYFFITLQYKIMKKDKNRAALWASLAFLTLAALLTCSCKNLGHKKRSLKIVNWNAQTFFDGNNDGIEYPNFVKSKKSGAWKQTYKCSKPVMKGNWNGIPVYGIPHPSSSVSNDDLGAAALYLRSELQKII